MERRAEGGKEARKAKREWISERDGDDNDEDDEDNHSVKVAGSSEDADCNGDERIVLHNDGEQ